MHIARVRADHASYARVMTSNTRKQGKLLVILLVVSFIALLAGCQPKANLENPPPLPQARVIDPPAGSDMLTANTYAGDAIANMLLKRMGGSSSILTTNLVSMDNLGRTSPFGRMAMQQIGSRVAQHGFRVIDVHLMEAMIINEKGEFMLSRDVCKILADKHNAYAVLVGVYTPTGSRLLVSVRALRLSDAAVIAAYEYHLPLGGDTGSLLAAGNGQSGTNPAWTAYASRGQAFANCTPSTKTATEQKAPATAQKAPAAPAKTAVKKAAPKQQTKVAAKRPVKRKKPAAPAYSPPAPAEPECPQDVPSNRRIGADDCSRRAATGYGTSIPVSY